MQITAGDQAVRGNRKPMAWFSYYLENDWFRAHRKSISRRSFLRKLAKAAN